jgi:hypothetical protein
MSARTNNLVERTAIVRNELRLQQEVFRRIPGDGQFGKRDQVRLGLPCFHHPVDDPARIAVEIPNGGIHLNHGNAKDAHPTIHFQSAQPQHVQCGCPAKPQRSEGPRRTDRTYVEGPRE